MNFMSNNTVKKEILEIARRIKELREICEVSVDSIADQLDVPVETYKAYENGEHDIPIGVIYGVARVLGVDSTAILTGEEARMADYTVVRKGHGPSIERYPGYSFSSLATNYKNRTMDPMIVNMCREDNPEPVVHGGQEFNYVLEGTIVVKIGEKEITLEAGDSIYFCPQKPHSQRSVTENAMFLTVINE